jgi:hypothetical protein
MDISLTSSTKRLLWEVFSLAAKSLRHAENVFFGRVPYFFGSSVLQLSKIVQEYAEKSFFNRLPLLVGNGVMSLAHGTLRNI